MRVVFENNEFELSNGDFVYGDSDGAPEFTFTGGNDSFVGEDGATEYGAVGDTWGMGGTSRGGNDTFEGGDNAGDGYAGPNSGVRFIGDAGWMGDSARGGRDYATAGVNGTTLFVGDASDATDHARGGNDTLIGGNAFSDSEGSAGNGDGYSVNFLFGDFVSVRGQPTFAESGYATPRGGNDSIVGGDSLAHEAQAVTFNLLSGDGYQFGEGARGGNDTVLGGDSMADDGQAGNYNILAGDAFFMSDAASGGKDTLYGGNLRITNHGGEGYAINYMAGDAMSMRGSASGGNDQLFGGNVRDLSHDESSMSGVFNLMAGDTFSASGDVTFGKDTLVGGDATGDGYAMNALYGDIGSSDSMGFPFPFPIGPSQPNIIQDISVAAKKPLDESFHFGNDKITGGNGNVVNYLVGDADWIGSDSTGGNDTIVAGDGYDNALIGDSEELAGKGGNDNLFSGKGDDDMWGDAQTLWRTAEGGADKFFFAPKNGNDVIHDFHVEDRDRIDLSAFKNLSPDFKNMGALMSSGRVEQTDEGVVLHLDLTNKASEDNTVLLIGVDVSDLVKASFNF